MGFLAPGKAGSGGGGGFNASSPLSVSPTHLETTHAVRAAELAELGIAVAVRERNPAQARVEASRRPEEIRRGDGRDAGGGRSRRCRAASRRAKPSGDAAFAQASERTVHFDRACACRFRQASNPCLAPSDHEAVVPALPPGSSRRNRGCFGLRLSACSRDRAVWSSCSEARSLSFLSAAILSLVFSASRAMSSIGSALGGSGVARSTSLGASLGSSGLGSTLATGGNHGRLRGRGGLRDCLGAAAFGRSGDFGSNGGIKQGVETTPIGRVASIREKARPHQHDQERRQQLGDDGTCWAIRDNDDARRAAFRSGRGGLKV